ncbi:hypothetical protein J3U08_11400 [Gilliamella sp. B2894]|uniref:hypothetical protein n=1 Tax=unclassified Gilliamella TaxID=2685620 RepID=UPI002269C382|nr:MULTISPECIES: hypothetical protein [unclassified Gilliamella]MCX8657394.1 hypothetical protein [Gilliamella sp. B2894]MCX8693171.1 hypothetical protein [Gilliamella sp. B2881]MCX8696152.1 hypothetical protein [Gilliamella sp. B2828]
MNKVTVNVLSVINKSSKITKESINNKEHFIIRDVVPVVDDVVMNNGLYPKDEIDKSYMSINGNLMPIGHPKVNGQFVSASNAKAINKYYGGAWAENVHKDNDKVLLDCYVDIEFAKNHEKGKQLLNRLESMMNGEDANPIHVSTGLILNKVYQSGKSKGKAYDWVATNMHFDHVAILLNEQGAATPSEGVGMFVNSDGEYQIENANLDDLEATPSNLLLTIQNTLSEALKKFKFNKKEEIDPMKEKILQVLSAKGIKTDGLDDEQLLTALNEQVAKEAIDKKKTDEDEEKKKKKDEEQNSEQTPKWAKTLIDKVNILEQIVSVNAAAEEKTMREAVKAAFGIPETAVNEIKGDALSALYAKCQKSVPVNSAYSASNSNQSICEMPE